MKLTLTFMIAAGGLLFATGCKNTDQIRFATNTQLGARIGVDPKQIPEIQVGYNRQEAAIVPLYIARPDDFTGKSQTTISGILEQSIKLSEQAKSQATAENWNTQGRQSAAAVQALLAEAQRLAAGKSGANGGAKSDSAVMLGDLAGRAAKLAASTNAPPLGEFDVLIALQNVERNRPKLVLEFEEQAKYVGKMTSAYDRQDAYSVIGTFKGNGTAATTGNNPNGVQASGGIAQYFATGIAAQLLAGSGAAAVSTAANAYSPETIEAISKNKIRTETERDALIKYLKNPDGTLNHDHLETVIKGTSLDPDGTKDFSSETMASVEEKLSDSGKWAINVHDLFEKIPASQ